jgi:hypothetical protein
MVRKHRSQHLSELPQSISLTIGRPFRHFHFALLRYQKINRRPSNLLTVEGPTFLRRSAVFSCLSYSSQTNEVAVDHPWMGSWSRNSSVSGSSQIAFRGFLRRIEHGGRRQQRDHFDPKRVRVGPDMMTSDEWLTRSRPGVQVLKWAEFNLT